MMSRLFDDIKLGAELIRYAHGRRTIMISSVIMIVVSLILMVLGALGQATVPPGYFMACVAMYTSQMLGSVMMSSQVQSSPRFKYIQTKVTTVIEIAMMLICFIVTLLLELVLVLIWPENIGHIIWSVGMTILSYILIILYSSVAYKSFGLATALFTILVVPLVMTTRAKADFMSKLLDVDILTVMLLGLAGVVAITLMGMLDYRIRLAIYKIPLSKAAQPAALRKHL